MHEWLELDILSLQNSTNRFADQQVHEVHASLVAQMVKCLSAMLETWVWFLSWKDSPGEGNGNPLQYSWLENPMDRGAW